MTAVGAHLRITGVVQGVGFRYTCYRQARNLKLVGWVRNRPDGSVEVLIEGDRSAVESLISELKVGPFSAVVRGMDVSWLEVSGKYPSFDIMG
ncbi:MAG TPA: acylphosphatase [Acidobacteriota bacterium]|nr:acylphosphatase [Acidobacteriota bacterium]